MGVPCVWVMFQVMLAEKMVTFGCLGILLLLLRPTQSRCIPLRALAFSRASPMSTRLTSLLGFVAARAELRLTWRSAAAGHTSGVSIISMANQKLGSQGALG